MKIEMALIGDSRMGNHDYTFWTDYYIIRLVDDEGKIVSEKTFGSGKHFADTEVDERTKIYRRPPKLEWKPLEYYLRTNMENSIYKSEGCHELIRELLGPCVDAIFAA